MEHKRSEHVVGQGRMAYPPPPESQCLVVVGAKLQRHRADRFWARMAWRIQVPVPGVASVNVERWIQSMHVVFN